MVTPENHMVFPEEPEPVQPSGAEIMAAIANLARQIPTLDQVRMAASQAAEQAVQEQLRVAQRNAAIKENEVIAEFQKKAAEIKAGQANGNNGNSNGHSVLQPGQLAVQQPSSLPSKFDSGFGMLSGILKIITENLVPMGTQMMNQSLDWQMKKVQIKMAMTDPVSMFQQMWAIDPQKARYMAMLGAPDLMQNQIPAIVANAISQTGYAWQKGMLSGGWQPPNPNVRTKGAWIIENGSQRWDDNAPVGPPPPLGPQGGAPANPLAPRVIDVTRLPGFGPAQVAVPPASPAAPPSGGPGLTAPPSAGPSVTPSVPPPVPPLSPSVTPVTPSSVSPSPIPVATMGGRDSILLRLRH